MVVRVVINQLLKGVSGVTDRISVAIISLIPANSKENRTCIDIVFYRRTTEGITTLWLDGDDLINPAFCNIDDKSGGIIPTMNRIVHI